MKLNKITLSGVLITMLFLLGLGLSTQVTNAQTPTKHTEGSFSVYAELVLGHEIDPNSAGTTTPSGNVGKSFWYNLTDAVTPFDEFFSGNYIFNQTSNLTIQANLENSKLRAVVLNEQVGNEGYLWDVAKIFYLGQDIVINSNLSQSLPTNALDNVVIPAGTPLVSFQPTWEWGNWSTFLDIVGKDFAFIKPMKGRSILSTTPSLLFLDESMWNANIAELGNLIAAIKNDSTFFGDIISQNATSGTTYQLYLSQVENVSDPLSAAVSLTFNWTDMDGTLARLDWMEFELIGDFDGNGTIDASEQFYFYWEFIGEDAADPLPYQVGQAGSYFFDSAVLQFGTSGDLATYFNDNGITPMLDDAAAQFGTLTGKPLMDYLITSTDGLYYGANVTVYTDFVKVLMNISNPNAMPPPDMPTQIFLQGIASAYLGLGGDNLTVVDNFVFHQPWDLPPFNDPDYDRPLRANSTGWLLLPDDPNIQDVKIFRRADIDPMQPIEDQVDTLPTVPILNQFYGEIFVGDAFYNYTIYGYLVQVDINSLNMENLSEGTFSEPLVAYYTFVPRPSYRLYVLDSPISIMGPEAQCQEPDPGSGSGDMGPNQPMPGPECGGPDPFGMLLDNMQLPYYYSSLFDVQNNASVAANGLLTKAKVFINDVLGDPMVVGGITNESDISNITVFVDLQVEHQETSTEILTNITASLTEIIDVYNDSDPTNIINGTFTFDVTLNALVTYDPNGTLLSQGISVDLYVEWVLDGLTFEELISPEQPGETQPTTPISTTPTTSPATSTTESAPTNTTESTPAPSLQTPGFEVFSLVLAIGIAVAAIQVKKRKK